MIEPDLSKMAKQRVCLCVFDLDNTLFDWVEMWYAMFSAKLAELSRISGIPEAVLKPEFKRIHQQHGTTEYPFAIQELPSLIAKHPGDDLAKLYDSAMHAYYSARKRTLVLYPRREGSPRHATRWGSSHRRLHGVDGVL